VTTARPRASYGVDAPYLLAVPAVLAAAGVLQAILTGRPWPLIGVALIVACSSLGLYASLRGKLVVWARLLDDLPLAGGEQIIDLGCGRGAVLLLAARRLSTGRAVGIDVWRGSDQSGNSLARTRRNAIAEGLSDRVELHTADMASLPFADATFDLVTSSLALHNIRGVAGRERAIDEATRVLRPGGRVLFADIRGTAQYRARLEELGMTRIAQRSLGWRMWWSGPWLRTRLVTAIKPGLPCSPETQPPAPEPGRRTASSRIDR
jgi:arsenite methyltransferase